MKNVNLLTKADCRTDINVWDINLEGQIVIIDSMFFKEEFRDAKYQMVRCTGGFGCDPSKMGNAIFVQELCNNPESYRIERCNRNIIGVPTNECYKEWMSIYGKEN